MGEGHNADKPEVKQQEESSSSIWSDIARDIAVATIFGAVGGTAVKELSSQNTQKQLESTAEQMGTLVLGTALPLVTMGLGAAAARGAIKGATAGLKAGEKVDESAVDKAFNIYKEVHSETLPFFVLGPLALIPQVREPLKAADGLVLDKVRAVSETMIDNAKREPWRFAGGAIASPLIPFLDAIIGSEK